MIRVLNNDFTVNQTIENGVKISYGKSSDQIDVMTFELSNDDVKMNAISERGYIELVDDLDGEYIGLYKVMPTLTSYSADSSYTKFTCYHVAVTLTDEVIDGKLTFVKKPLKYIIGRILDQQVTKHWQVGDILLNTTMSCEFEDVNSLHEPLTEIMDNLPLNYVWEYDTEVYPWRLNLIKIKEEPVARVKLGYNLESFEIEADPSNIINRVIAKGILVTPKYDTSGKEISRIEKIITLADIPGIGKRYIEDADSIRRYGVISYVHAGEEYYDPMELYFDALNILTKGRVIPMNWRIQALDLSKLDSETPTLEIDKFKVNSVVRAETEYFGDIDLYIREINKPDMTGEPQNIELVLDSGGKIPGVNFSTMKRDLDKNVSKIKDVYDKSSTLTKIVETTFTLDENGNIILDKELAESLRGQTGKGIESTDIKYAKSTSGTTPPETGWVLLPPSANPGDYVWTRTIWTYTDNTNETVYSVGKIGNTGPAGPQGQQGIPGSKGSDGAPGKDGVGLKSSEVSYAVNQSGTTAPTSGWTFTIPTSKPGDYMWTRTVWLYTDNTTETAYSVGKIGLNGNTGSNGVAGKDGVGIKTTTITYAKSTSGTTAPTSGWVASPPSANPGEFIWTKTVWAYTDNTTETGYSVGKIGNTGTTGPQGPAGEDAVVWSATPPTDTNKIWGDTTENIIKRYDSERVMWVPLDKAALEALEEYQNSVDTQISDAVGEVSKEIEQTINDVKALEGDLTSVKGDISDVDTNRLEVEANLKDLIDTNKANIEAELQMINTYFNFSPDGLLIGKDGNPIKMLLDNDSMVFVDNGVEVAGISNEELVITDGVIKRSLTLGNFEFVPRESGNLSFRKRG